MTDTTRKDALQHPMTNVERNALAGALTAIVKRNALAHDNAALINAHLDAMDDWCEDCPDCDGVDCTCAQDHAEGLADYRRDLQMEDDR